MCWRRSFPASESPNFFWEAEFSDRSEVVLGTLSGARNSLFQTVSREGNETCILAEFGILLSFCMFLLV